MPVAAMDEDRDLASRICDVRPAGRLAPVESIPAEPSRSKRRPQTSLGTGITRPIGAHDISDCRARGRWVGKLEARHRYEAAARAVSATGTAISLISSSAIRSTSPTTRALPIMNARLPSDIPVVQSPGKPSRRSSSRGVRRRNRPSSTWIRCLKRDGVAPPSPVRIVPEGPSMLSGKGMDLRRRCTRALSRG